VPAPGTPLATETFAEGEPRPQPVRRAQPEV
jgi:hypothetical protein